MNSVGPAYRTQIESTMPRPCESNRLKSTPASTAAAIASGASSPSLLAYVSRDRLIRKGPTTVLPNLSRSDDMARKNSLTEQWFPFAW